MFICPSEKLFIQLLFDTHIFCEYSSYQCTPMICLNSGYKSHKYLYVVYTYIKTRMATSISSEVQKKTDIYL